MSNFESGYPKPTELLQQKIGYRFENHSYLQRALTHSSYSNEQGEKHHHLLCNERLEFLGDSVLSVVVSRYLYTTFPGLAEGELTRLRAELVCERALSSFAARIHLGDYLLLGVGEDKNHGRERRSILADAFEALLAAIYLDAAEQGFERVEELLLPLIQDEIANADKQGSSDYKTLLQQFVQQTEGDFLEYVTVSESGPDHQKTFTVEARLNSNVIGKGQGQSKRRAEQNAARQALELFGVQP
ncbi:MAG: ribonuclease III [Clostridia bacterium]|jgi:ribonuclease-3|nr:ribonuclease III [Clostridia bacterium]